LKNTDLFFREVAPALRDMWDDEWENHWWPTALQQPTSRATASA
jgi:hypothetical protein